MRYKYPRTFHLPFSLGVQSDDKIQQDLSVLETAEDVVVTIKMDGENTTIGHNYSHARSLDSGYHPSRNLIKSLQASIGYRLSEEERICGENCYAKHSIAYQDLPENLFLMFSFWKNETCLSWIETVEKAKELNLELVKVLYQGKFDIKLLKELSKEKYFSDGTHEGFVVRNANSFHYQDFSKNVVKFVRKGHVQTDKHWMNSEIIKNGVRSY